MIIMKFGGSSVGTPEAIRAAAHAVRLEIEKEPVVVTSALYGVTDLLVRAGDAAHQGDADAMQEAFDEIGEIHAAMADSLGMPNAIPPLMEELKTFLESLTSIAEVSEHSWARLLSFGERLAVHFFASALEEKEIHATPMDARSFLRLHGMPRSAQVDFDGTAVAARTLMNVLKGRVPVVTGFIGADKEERTLLLGRGGSDYTASILGEALRADEIVICKEVDGILSADPRIVPDAGLLERISYDEAAEMSYFGAKVLHPKTMIPAVRAGIPIRLKNTFQPEAPGTLISQKGDQEADGVKTVSAHRGLRMVTIEGKGMAGISGFAAQLFGVAGRIGVNVIMFTQASSEQTICLVVGEEDGMRLEAALEDTYRDAVSMHAIEAIRISGPVAAIAVVGDGMRGKRGIAGRVFSAVADADVNVLAIAQGSSERNISFIVEDGAAEHAIRSIHAALDMAVTKKSKTYA